MERKLDNRGFEGTILMDLSKVYDCIPHGKLFIVCDYCKIASPIANKDLNYVWHLARDIIQVLVYHKVQFLDLYCSIYLSIIYQ